MYGVYAVLMGILVGLAVWLARLSGKQSARLQALKKEAQQYVKSQQIVDRVRNLPADVVRRRLQERTK
ncbi:MAG: hypothetical protein J5601_00850 [Elusimicrobiaceae bacterium]|nr:hypothetical protein [Elusimicrobiaceae bacterium]